MRGWMRNLVTKTRCEPFNLGLPVANERRRHHEQAGRLTRSPVTFEQEKKRNDLDRLPQSHVIGQASTESQAIEKPEPAHAGLLIGAQRGMQQVAGIGLALEFSIGVFQLFKEP